MKLKPLPLAVAAVLAARATLPLAANDPDPVVDASDSADVAATQPAPTAPDVWPYLAEIDGQTAEIFVAEWADGRYSIAVDDAKRFGWISPEGARGQVVLEGVESAPERLMLTARIPSEPTILDVEVAAPAMTMESSPALSARVNAEVAKSSAAEDQSPSSPSEAIPDESLQVTAAAETPAEPVEASAQAWPYVAEIGGRKAEVFVTQAGDQYSISAEDAQRFGAREGLTGSVVLENVVANQFDLTLTADLPVSALDPRRISSTSRESARLLAQHDGWAGWLNYTLDGRYSGSSGETLYSLLTDVNVSLPFGGVLRSYQIVGSGSVQSKRLMTSYVLDLPESLTSLTLGDAYSSSYALASGQKFAGVQLRRNYGLNPDYVYYPTIDLTGSASAPSVYEIFEGNRRVSGGSLERGEFSLENYSAFLGQSGQIRLIVRDAQGAEQVITRDLFTAPEALKAGELSYALDAGVAYAVDDEFGKPYGSGALRYGLSRVTLEGGLDLRSGDLSGFAGFVLPSGWGNWSFRHIQGDENGAGRTIDRANWEKRFAFDADRDLRLYASAEWGANETSQVGVSYSTGSWSVFGTALQIDGEWSYSGGASLTQDRFSVSGTLAHSDETGLVAGLQLSVPLGRSTVYASASDDRYGLGANGVFGADASWSYSGNIYQTNGETEASGSVRRDFDRVRGEVYADYRRGNGSYRGRALGSVVATGDGVTLARPVNSGLLLVDTGIEGVPVRASGRTHRAHIGSTTVIPTLPAYASTLVQPDYDALPGGYTADVDRQAVRIPQGVSRLAFDVRAPGFFAQIFHRGTAVERGVTVRADGQPVVIVSTGAYIQPRAGQSSIQIEVGDCSKSVPVPEKALTKVEVEVCEAQSASQATEVSETD